MNETERALIAMTRIIRAGTPRPRSWAGTAPAAPPQRAGLRRPPAALGGGKTVEQLRAFCGFAPRAGFAFVRPSLD